MSSSIQAAAMLMSCILLGISGTHGAARRLALTAPTSAITSSNDPLYLHNQYRTYNHAPAMAWSSTLASSAQTWANTLAQKCSFFHSGSGENLASGYPSWSSALWGWYSEYKLYNWAAPGFSSSTGHFTQMVWVSSTKLGCGMAYNACTRAPIYVCHYDVPGNVNTVYYFQKNVLKP